MAFDFENNIQTDLSGFDICDKDAFIQACKPITQGLHLQMGVATDESTIFVKSTYTQEIFLKTYNPTHLFSFFLQVYDKYPYAFYMYDINTIPAFKEIFQGSKRHVTDQLLSSNLLIHHKDLSNKYFHVDEGRIKYDIPMILTYLAFVNKHFEYILPITVKYYIHLFDSNIIAMPQVIITKNELWQFLLTISYNPAKFVKLRINDTFQSMLTKAVFKHYGINLKIDYLHNSNLLCDVCDHVITSLLKEGIRVDNKDAYILDI